MSSATLKINLTSISNNWKKIHNFSGSSVATAAVLKANAYGLGVKPIAKHLFKTGARTFFVSNADEGVELRQALNETAEIYYLNGYQKGDCDAISEYQILPVLNSMDQIDNFNHQTNNQKAAIQIDLGMNRLGISNTEILKLKPTLDSLKIKLIIGHLSSADDKSSSKNEIQYSKFSKFSQLFHNIPKSLSATGGVLLGNKYHFDLTRPGIGIFGGMPLDTAENVVRLNLPVIQVRDVQKNEGIGYNHTFVTKTPKRIATVASGYADGLARQLSNNGVLYYENTKCPILGRVSMDLITVDISRLSSIPTTLVALGDNQTIDDLATQASTIGYEILTSLGSRYKRVYHY